jgi:hypothetical protein
MVIQLHWSLAMMGQQTGTQPKIFYPHMNLDQRVPRTHLLRKIQEQIDFNFIYVRKDKIKGSDLNIQQGSRMH